MTNSEQLPLEVIAGDMLATIPVLDGFTIQHCNFDDDSITFCSTHPISSRDDAEQLAWLIKETLLNEHHWLECQDRARWMINVRSFWFIDRYRVQVTVDIPRDGTPYQLELLVRQNFHVDTLSYPHVVGSSFVSRIFYDDRAIITELDYLVDNGRRCEVHTDQKIFKLWQLSIK